MLRRLAVLAFFAVPTTAEAAWQQASSKHFVVYADDAPDKVKAFATDLERIDKAMRAMRTVPETPISPMSRVTVYVVKSGSDVRRIGGKGMSGVAGFYIPRASSSVAFAPREDLGSGSTRLDASAVLLHEYAHHFMFANMGETVFPAWLVEGFAEFHATAKTTKDGAVIVGDPPQYRVYGILMGSDMPIRTLLTAQPGKMSGEDREKFYGRGWLLTHYLTMDDARRKQLTQYLTALNNGSSSIEAAKVFGDLGKLNTALDSYAKKRLQAFSIPATLLAIEPVTVRALTPGEAAILPAQIASQRGVDASTAPGVATRARSLAAPFPNDPAAQNALAEAEYDAHDFGAARAAADRAVAADPGSVHAMMYAGLSRLAIARDAKAADPAVWAQARQWFVKANHAEPEYAWPLEMNYRSYVAARQTPPKNAEEGLLYAYRLAPFDTGLGMTAAYIHLKRGEPQDADRALRPIAYNPHGGEAAVLAQSMLDLIAAKGGAAVVAAMDAINAQAAGGGATH